MFVPMKLLGVETFVPKEIAHTVEMTCLPAEIGGIISVSQWCDWVQTLA